MNLKCILLDSSSSIHQAICSYVPEVRTFNIVTEYMSDECIPYRVNTSVCVWLTATGTLGEIELIYPRQISEQIVWASSNIKTQKGRPYFKDFEYEYENVVVEVSEEQFVIWLNNNGVIDLEVEANNILYLFNYNRLVGLCVKGYETITYSSNQ
ncbi:hypothetical protein [Paenibacillus kandeliae]|uniref:hypothetical protein n=1 Tax=Paenibacillus kandeliae TaxID=3231269 RepID=UPI00345A2336